MLKDVNDFDVTCPDHALMLVNIQSYFYHEDLDNLREAPRNIIWDEVKVMTFKNNLSCICKSKELRDTGNNCELSDHERVDQW